MLDDAIPLGPGGLEYAFQDNGDYGLHLSERTRSLLRRMRCLDLTGGGDAVHSLVTNKRSRQTLLDRRMQHWAATMEAHQQAASSPEHGLSAVQELLNLSHARTEVDF